MLTSLRKQVLSNKRDYGYTGEWKHQKLHCCIKGQVHLIFNPWTAAASSLLYL